MGLFLWQLSSFESRAPTIRQRHILGGVKQAPAPPKVVDNYRLSRLAWAAIRWRLRFRCDRRRRFQPAKLQLDRGKIPQLALQCKDCRGPTGPRELLVEVLALMIARAMVGRLAMGHGGNMSHRMLLISLWLAVLGPTSVAADDNPLLGTWRLKSFVREVSGSGEHYNQMGEQPDGYISYAADGRMLALFVSADQPRPRAEPTDEERIKLHKSMLAYGGTYTLSPGKVVHHVDIEWDGRRLGADQVRFYTVEVDKLVIKTEPNKSPVDGREGVGILTFERVKSPP